MRLRDEICSIRNDLRSIALCKGRFCILRPRRLRTRHTPPSPPSFSSASASAACRRHPSLPALRRKPWRRSIATCKPPSSRTRRAGSQRDFLWIDQLPDQERERNYAALKQGQAVIRSLQSCEPRCAAASGGLIHAWVRIVFVPGVPFVKRSPLYRIMIVMGLLPAAGRPIQATGKVRKRLQSFFFVEADLWHHRSDGHRISSSLLTTRRPPRRFSVAQHENQ